MLRIRFAASRDPAGITLRPLAASMSDESSRSSGWEKLVRSKGFARGSLRFAAVGASLAIAMGLALVAPAIPAAGEESEPAGSAPGVPTEASSASDAARRAVEQLVADYIALYSGPTLDRWSALFHPALRVAFPAADGSVRTLDAAEFVERQRAYFATGRPISERLENVRIEMGRRIARVSADFVFEDDGEERPGTLGLHLVEGPGGWKIVSLLFAYDDDPATAAR